jgi:hypothetical protein
MLLADSTRPPMVNLEEGPSALRVTLEADDGTFGAPRAIGPGSGALAAFAADRTGEMALVGMLTEGPVVYRGRFDGPLTASHSLNASGGYDIDAVPLAAGGALAGYVTPQGAAEVVVAPPGGDFGRPHRLAEYGKNIRVATAADGSAVAAWTEGDFYETEVRAAWRGADGSWSPPQTVVSNAQAAPAPLRLAAAGDGRAVLAANTGGILRVAVSDDHRFSALTTFAQGDPADVGIDADGDAVLAWKGWTGPARVLVSRLDAGRAQWGPSEPVGSCGADVATAIDSHGTAVIALLDMDQDGLDDRLSAALWPRAGTLPQPQVLWDDPTVPTDIAVGTDDADRATIGFSGYGSTGRPLIAVRTAASATDAAAVAAHDPRLEPTNCRRSPGAPTPIPSVPPGPAPIMHSDRRARLVHGRLQLKVSCAFGGLDAKRDGRARTGRVAHGTPRDDTTAAADGSAPKACGQDRGHQPPGRPYEHGHPPHRDALRSTRPGDAAHLTPRLTAPRCRSCIGAWVSSRTRIRPMPRACARACCSPSERPTRSPRTASSTAPRRSAGAPTRCAATSSRR